MAGARATAAILAGLPVLGGAAGSTDRGPAAAASCWAGTRAGGCWWSGSTLACCGLLWSDRITDRRDGMSAAARVERANAMRWVGPRMT